jgi:hypothetical protein
LMGYPKTIAVEATVDDAISNRQPHRLDPALSGIDAGLAVSHMNVGIEFDHEIGPVGADASYFGVV